MLRFGGDIRDRQLVRKCTRDNNCVERLSLPNAEGDRKFVHGDFPLLFLKHASLTSKDYACQIVFRL